ncbi:MAG: DNA polymerase III subunit delta [Candidatus Delongbacteria bacterium]|nr:DNA polymerase III subunit delta [Candidatus Delongbacteria bacterium]
MTVKPKKDVNIKEFRYFLLTGEDQYSIELKSAEIVSAFLSEDLKDFNYSHFNEENMNAEMIGSEIYSLPVMADQRIVVVSDIDRSGPDITETLSRFLKKNVDTTILILRGKKPDKRKSFFKELVSNKKCLAIEFKEKNEREIQQWIKNYISSKGYNISFEGLQLLSLTLSSNLSQVSSEADKLIEYSKGKNITEDDVEKVLGISKEYNIFKLQQAVVDKNLKKACLICDNIMKNKNNKTDPIAINLFLSRIFTSAFEIGYYALTNQTTVDKSAFSLGYNNPWKDADIVTCAKKFKPTELLRCQRYFLECDIKLKSSYQPPETAVFLLLEKVIKHSDDKTCEYMDFFNTTRK